MTERILIVGKGAREHAIGWKLYKEAPPTRKPKLFFTQGTPGMSTIGTNIDISPDDIYSISRFISDDKIDITIVGPELPLSKGIVDSVREDHNFIVGPTQNAARLETDKIWALDFMDRHGIPHPDSFIAKNFRQALDFIANPKWDKYVIKFPGLAGGKGVTLPENRDQALVAVRDIFVYEKFGAAEGAIFQDKLEGDEVSMLFLTDGKTISRFLPARDFKRLSNDPSSPNTGGMGSYAPVELNPEIQKECFEIAKKTIEGMSLEENPMEGILYVGFMITKAGPMVLEYNTRGGNPETQVLLRLMKSNLLKAFRSTVNKDLKQSDLTFYPGFAADIVVTGKDYPYKESIGEKITLPEKLPREAVLFHGGTRWRNKALETNGGRIIDVTMVGNNPGDTIRAASRIADKVIFEGAYHRDILI